MAWKESAFSFSFKFEDFGGLVAEVAKGESGQDRLERDTKMGKGCKTESNTEKKVRPPIQY